MRDRLLIVVLSIMSVFCVTTLQADSYLKQVNFTAEFTMMGQKQPSQSDTMEIWMAKEKAAVVMPSSNMKVIVMPKEGQMYMVNLKDKKYAVMPLAIDEAVAKAIGEEGGDSIADSAADQMNAMMQGLMGNMEVTVTPTAETKMIGKWNSKKYDVAFKMAMMKLTSETWATKDIVIDYSIYQACANAMMAQLPGFEKLIEEMKKIEGVVVQQIGKMEMMGTQVETTTTLLEYADKDAPTGMYDLSKDYQLVKMADLGVDKGGM